VPRVAVEAIGFEAERPDAETRSVHRSPPMSHGSRHLRFG
jgi:hypothetical protein